MKTLILQNFKQDLTSSLSDICAAKGQLLFYCDRSGTWLVKCSQTMCDEFKTKKSSEVVKYLD